MTTPADHDGSALVPRARKALNALLRARFVSALCTPRDIDDYLELIDAAWSVREARARIVGVRREAGGATSLLLHPNENWSGFRAGQYVRISVRIDGVRYDRCFSISSAPAHGLPLRITIKELPGSRVGTWAAQRARRGAVVGMSQALGDFVIPQPAPARLLFISGGSGITPIAAMIGQLLATGYRGELTCLHYARHEPILGGELSALASRHARLRFVPVRTSGDATGAQALRGHVSLEHLEAVAPQWPDCETYVCGPPPLEAAVAELARAHKVEQRLHVERFVSAVQLPAAEGHQRFRVTFANSGRVVDTLAGTSLLALAEASGLHPPHGCRMGICHTCKCKKLSGVVRNMLTGALDAEALQEIQLCIHAPCSDVALAL